MRSYWYSYRGSRVGGLAVMVVEAEDVLAGWEIVKDATADTPDLHDYGLYDAAERRLLEGWRAEAPGAARCHVCGVSVPAERHAADGGRCAAHPRVAATAR